MVILWIYHLLLISVLANANIERASYCYGDSSGGSSNLVDVSCTSGAVYINDVITATKPSSQNCPMDDHAYSPAEQIKCCTYTETDCTKSFSGSWQNFLKCNGQKTCSGVPVVRDEPICSDGDFPRFSNYMVLEYYCMPAGFNYGPCNTTADCNDPAAKCDKSFCECQDGYTTFFAFDDCWRDGGLNGSCTGPVGCQDAHTYCDFASGRCQCDVGFFAYNGSCVQGGYNFGYCVSTADCTDPQAMCDTSVCVCDDGYTAFAEFDDCWRDGGLNGSCAGSIGCQDNFTSCDSATDRCKCITGYAPTDGHCYADGELHGYCQSNGDCADANAACTTERCECVTGYRDIAGICRQDGRLHGFCETGNIECVDNNTKCENGVCNCGDEYSAINGICKEDGELGGLCTEDSDCTDENAKCVAMPSNSAMAICECKDGYRNIDGECIKDGELHGYCQSNGDCADANAACTNERCECVTGYRDIAGICRQDGRLHGYCETGAIECIDSNTKCENGVCNCEDEYTAINGTCKRDGELGGLCTEDSDCTDENAKCVTMPANSAMSICECKDGFTNINGNCIEDGTLYGLCTGSVVCKDNNTVCNSTSSRCECSTGYVPYTDACYADGDLHGFCTQDADCQDGNAKCTNQRCECIEDFRDIDGICREDGHLLGFCEVTVDCIDDNSECSEGICVCIDGYTDVDGSCIKDGDLGGACGENNHCADENADCEATLNSGLSLCTCTTNYTNIGGECKQDRRVGGRCTSTNTCLDALSNCSTQGICTCIAGHSEVNDMCKEDGKEGGVCGQSGQGEQGVCSEENTECQTDTQRQCGGSNCVPGVCKCKINYHVGYYGTCTKDGDVGGVCNFDSDCKDANANCIGDPLFCMCSTGYRDVDGTCVKDGDPGGYCLSGNICSDPHSICVNGTCICNDKRNYIRKAGRCQRNDTFINGECKEDDDSEEGDEIACLDTNAKCSGNKCICRTGFSQTNGICTIGNISSVTACNGSSPYNQLVPDCDLDYVPVILETYQRVKPASKNCPDQVNLYSDTIFSQCCSYEDGDCRLDGTGDDACSPTDLSGDYTSYTVIDYVCAPDGSVIDAAANTTVQNNQVYVVGVSGQRQCSVTASCKTDISVYIVFLTLNEVNSQCNQTLTITEGTDATTFECGYQVTNSEEAVFTSSSEFFTFNITNPDQGGRFVLEIQAEITTADVIVACGSQAASEGPDTFGKCGAEAGRLRGNCSSEIICKDPHTICENGICQCQNGYREFETECLEIVTEEDDTSSASALLAVIIPVAILLTLAIAGAAFWLLKNKIRKKCFPEKEAALIQPINGGPSPMNVKYPGRGAPSDVGIPKVMPPPWTNSGWSPMNEKFRGNTDIKSALPARLPPISSSPMNTKFSGPSSNPENVADYLYKEEMSAENNLQKKRKTKKNSISPREDNIIKVGSVANGNAVSENTQDRNKKQKKNKKPKKSKIGIKTKQSFKLPTHPGETTEGVFTPTQSFYSVPQQGQNVMNGAPSLKQSLQPQNMPYLATPSGHLPPLSASFQSGRPQMNGGVQSFDPRASWRTAGSVASVAVQPKLRRPSVLDIQSVDDPTNIEHTELSN